MTLCLIYDSIRKRLGRWLRMVVSSAMPAAVSLSRDVRACHSHLSRKATTVEVAAIATVELRLEFPSCISDRKWVSLCLSKLQLLYQSLYRKHNFVIVKWSILSKILTDKYCWPTQWEVLQHPCSSLVR